MIETFIVNGDGMMLDNLLWQRYRRRTPGLLEHVLDMNPGLAAFGPVLPDGTRVILPVLQEPATAFNKVVKLWD